MPDTHAQIRRLAERYFGIEILPEDSLFVSSNMRDLPVATGCSTKAKKAVPSTCWYVAAYMF